MRNLVIHIIIWGTLLIMGVVMIGAIIGTLEAVLIRNAYEQQQEDEDLYAYLETFEIEGKKAGTNDYYLSFIFDGWSINNMHMTLGNSGTIKKNVDIPALSGNRTAMAYQFFRQHGFTPEGACGLMANINSESGGKWESNIEEGFKSYQGKEVERQGYGLCQWTNSRYGSGRRKNVLNFLEGRGLDVTKDSKAAFTAELEYAITEHGYEGIVSKVKQCTSVAEATSIWCKEWERPANAAFQASKRTKTAKKYLEKYGNSSFDSNSTVKAPLELKYTYDKESKTFNFEGTLNGTDIAGSFTVKNNEVSGSGKYGDGAGIEHILSTAPGGSMSYPLPKLYPVTSEFAPRWGKIHGGMDIAAPAGTKILAAADGVVSLVESHYSWGNHVMIQHSKNLKTNYAHMTKWLVKSGQQVSAGDVIGLVGSTGQSTGPHLHFEVWVNGQRVNPRPYIYK